MITIFCQQSGKLISGTPVNITEFSFELVDDYGNYLGRFPLDNWPKDVPREDPIIEIENKNR